MESKLYNMKGETVGKFDAPENIFGLKWNADLVHQVMLAMQANARPNVAHTKDRGEVRGGGKKPWQQKGPGRARHGSSRSPIWVGGGVAHGPRNDKNFTRKINKKAKVRALYAILSKKFKDGEILFVDSMNITTAKSKDAKKIISSLATIKGYEKLATKPTNAAMITFDKKTEALSKSFRNFGNVSVEEFRNINPVSILNHSYLIVTNPEVSLKMLSAKIKSE